MRVAQDFDAKRPDEVEAFAFDFRRRLREGEVITDATVCVVAEGDTTETAIGMMLSGTATISGSVVTQLVQGGDAGSVYTLICTAQTDAGQTLVEMRDLPVVADLTLD